MQPEFDCHLGNVPDNCCITCWVLEGKTILATMHVRNVLVHVEREYCDHCWDDDWLYPLGRENMRFTAINERQQTRIV